MRIIATLSDQIKARQLSAFLASEGIENQLEIQTISDWGSTHYGDQECRLWVIDEDQLAAAQRWVQKYETDAEDPLFKPFVPSPVVSLQAKLEQQLHHVPSVSQPGQSPAVVGGRKTWSFTLALLILCSLLFLMIESTTPPIPKTYPVYLPAVAVFSPPIKKALFYDYPKKFELANQLVNLYGLEALALPQNLPEEGQQLLTQYLDTPYWQGIYPLLVAAVQGKWAEQAEMTAKAPLFEKIRAGELWRLFTPCLMHNDILHLLFNMIWLMLLGKQLEERLRGTRYLSLILLTGIFSNTCQYLMSGLNFIGISGVLCAMLAFIWVRQKRAPWEGYPLQKATITFMMVFILGIFSLQLFSFYLEASGEVGASIGIANTAHLSGAALGALLGLLPFFSWKT
jgi:GlpG protein